MTRSQQNVSSIASAARSNESGLGPDVRGGLAQALAEVLERTYSLLIRTQTVHWNVRGQNFYSTHLLTEMQYKAIFDAIDEIAERVLALGFHVPAKNGAVLSPTGLVFDPDAGVDEMLEMLARDNEACASQARDIADLADKERDFVSHDLLTARIAEHEKAAWMLRAQKSRG